VQPTLTLGLVRDSQCEVAATRFSGNDQVSDAESLAVREHPTNRGDAVVQPGWIWMNAQLAGRVAEFDADDDKPCGSEVFASAHDSGVGGAEDGHAAAVQVHDARQAHGGVRSAEIQRKVLAIAARDCDGRGCHSFGDRHSLCERLEYRSNHFFGLGGEGQPIVEWRVNGHRQLRQESVNAERREGLDHSGVGAWIGSE
jgi:hypothetical protein